MLRNLLFISFVLIMSGFVYLSYTKPANLPSPLQTFSPSIRNTIDQGKIGILSVMQKNEKTTSTVMGISTQASKLFQEDTSETPIHQKAIEFTQYQYCLQVVEQYQRNYSPSPRSEEKSEE